MSTGRPPTVVICGGIKHIQRSVQFCPTCDQRRRFTITYTSAYYDATYTCNHCGEQWAGAEMLPRPFRPGWRKSNAGRAREQWKRGVAEPPKFERDEQGYPYLVGNLMVATGGDEA